MEYSDGLKQTIRQCRSRDWANVKWPDLDALEVGSLEAFVADVDISDRQRPAAAIAPQLG